MQWLLFFLLLTAAHGVSSASIEHVIPRAADTTTQTHVAPEADCTEKATLIIKHLDKYLAIWEKERGVNRMDAIPHSFWFDLATDVPPDLLPELFCILWHNRERTFHSFFLHLYGVSSASIEHVIPRAADTTTAQSTISVETTEPLDMCLLRTKAYIRYFDMFEHYEAWQRYKWMHVYGFKGEYASIEDYLWDDFLVWAPYDHPEFEDLMELLRKLLEKKDRWLWDDERLAEVLCEKHYSLTDNGEFEYLNERDEYAYHSLGYDDDVFYW